MGVVPKSIYGNRTVEAQKDLHLLKLVKVGDFVISLRSFQGGIEYAYYQGIISPAYTIMINNGLIESSYFKYLAKSRRFIEILKICVTGIREGQNIDYNKLKNNLIPVPPLSEQEAIVKFLDYKVSRIEKLILIRERQIVNLKELKKAVINKAVTKGDWKRVRLKRVAKLNPTCSFHGIKPEDEVTFAPMECIRTDRRIEINATLSKNNSSYNSFNEGDIALAKVTPCFENGNVCIMENLTRGYAFGSSELFNIRPFNIKPRYLLYYLMTDFFQKWWRC
ncbi:MAG: restriction endonuclease subunit S [Synergistaceae bacterium]|nr:restriction endonuclease subunit S [Synergistaceae bacterium]